MCCQSVELYLLVLCRQKYVRVKHVGCIHRSIALGFDRNPSEVYSAVGARSPRVTQDKGDVMVRDGSVASGRLREGMAKPCRGPGFVPGFCKMSSGLGFRTSSCHRKQRDSEMLLFERNSYDGQCLTC